MSKTDKLIIKFLSRPKDFTWAEAVSVLSAFGYELIKNSGSKRKFYNKKADSLIILHEPHPEKTIKQCYIKYIIDTLTDKGLLK